MTGCSAPEGHPPSSQRPRGRPSTYTPERAAAVIELMREQGLGLVAACKLVGLPKSTFQSWAAAEPTGELAEAYRRAQIVRALIMLDECQAIADDSRRDWIETTHGPKLDHAHIRRCEARIKFRLSFADRYLPPELGGLRNVCTGEIQVLLAA